MTVQWGVIGSGGIARRRTIPEGLAKAAGGKLVAVYDVSGQANREVAAQFGAAECATEEELLARKDVDAVYIATPAHLHARQATAAARAGKHVLCEKPLGLTVAEAEAVVAACRKAGVTLAVDFMMRFHAYHRAAKRMIDEGTLGRMVLGRAQLSCWYPPIPGAWRQDPATGGGGSLIDMGGHCIDLLETFLGRARRVSCRTGPRRCAKSPITARSNSLSKTRAASDKLPRLLRGTPRNRWTFFSSLNIALFLSAIR